MQQLDEEPAEKKRKYTQWLSSPLIHDILKAYRDNGRSARSTVASLQRRFPRLPSQNEGRYEALTESTVRSWFDENGDLLEKCKRLLDEGYKAGPGMTRAFAAFPAAEARMKEILTKMREHALTGINVSVQSIRWVMLSVMSDMAPELLDKVKLCKSFISLWARQQMNWTWRAGTTEASKVPEDWAEQSGDDAAIHRADRRAVPPREGS